MEGEPKETSTPLELFQKSRLKLVSSTSISDFTLADRIVKRWKIAVDNVKWLLYSGRR